ncbi:hypothetical protein ACFQZX_00380 [Mucilaginibacter litoreus]|uniref:Uncharacterized protein n=1 Tax=Mucilaginibacter litoreus TaxID=1048221 RepID=A0ABW3AM25_9SPHI
MFTLDFNRPTQPRLTDFSAWLRFTLIEKKEHLAAELRKEKQQIVYPYLLISESDEVPKSLAAHKDKKRIYLCINLEHQADINLITNFIVKWQERIQLVIYNISEHLFRGIEGQINLQQTICYIYRVTSHGKKFTCTRNLVTAPFELLLKTNNGQLTLFEQNTLVTLQTDLKPQLSKENDADRIQGYRIKDSHFRIGSKIHTSNFYYAKRLFQNSAYASCFAFIIAKDLIREHFHKPAYNKPKRNKKQKPEGITLIGYGLYSEMLLSLCVKFLSSYLTSIPVNHDIISDEENLQRIKKRQEVYRNIVLIIPIASTFSTSIKIEEVIRRDFAQAHILEPHLNLLHIYDDSEKNEDGLTVNEVKFGWKKRDAGKKTVWINALSAKKDQQKRQRYFIELPTTWYDVNKCKLCFPDKPEDERPLLITDKTSVTPILVFDTPRSRKITDNHALNLPKNTLYHGHYASDRDHYMFYLDKENLFRRNQKGLTPWLKSLANQPIFEDRTKKQYVILAPGNPSNAGFVNLVNTVLLDGLATIIHYDPSQDHIQNFSAFYDSVINPDQQESVILFVDDTLVSGATFFKSNYFLKHTRSDNNGFDGCIIMLNRSSHFVNKNIVRKLKGKEKTFFSYANLHLPSIIELDESCPLCKEKERYELLASKSFLDKLKVHFLAKSAKLRLTDTAHLNEKKDDNKYLIRVECTHLIYEWFADHHRQGGYHHFDKLTDYELWRDQLLGRRTLLINHSVFNSAKEMEAHLTEIDDAILKILTQSPFTYYKPVRQKVFGWVITLLERQMQHLLAEMEAGQLGFESIRNLKFLIRRAGLLNANYLISIPFLEFLHQLFGPKGVPQLSVDVESEIYSERGTKSNTDRAVLEKQLFTLRNLKVFYLAQVKELLYLNEARSIRLEERLIEFNKRSDNSPDFLQLLRMLREENGILVQNFLEFMSREPSWKSELTQYYGNRLVADFIQTTASKDHYRSQTANDFFNLQENSGVQTIAFQNYLYLTHYLTKEQTEEKELSKKTGLIMEKLKEIVCPQPEQSGVLFLVKYKTNRPDNIFLAYNEAEPSGLPEFELDNPENYLIRFLNGKPDVSKRSIITIVELCKKDHKWSDLYATLETGSDGVQLNFEVPEIYDRLLLLRINKRYLNHSNDPELIDEAQGVICFYFKASDGNPTDVNRLRYLLLLRSAISDFVQSHHEHNEFRDWMDADSKKRTALLTGHGRESLLLIHANYKEDRYERILGAMLVTQRYIIDRQDFLRVGFKEEAIAFYKEIFDNRSVINRSHLANEIVPMVKQLFRYEEIENTESVSVDLDPKIPDFIFSKRILEMICFELIVNAKKNRWIFADGKSVEAADGTHIYENKIWINVKRSKSSKDIIFELSNTCPMVPDKRIQALKSQQNNQRIKGANAIAGTELIASVLNKFKLGKIDFSCLPLGEGMLLSKFTVSLTLTDASANK